MLGLQSREVLAPGSGAAAIFNNPRGEGRPGVALEKITGFSEDSCVYHLSNNPPAVPHPYPNDAWHVNIRFGGTVREYTPISTALDWEMGKLDILVKTYTGTSRLPR